MIRTVQDNRKNLKIRQSRTAALKESNVSVRRALVEDDEADDADNETDDEADVELANEGPKTIVIDGVTYDLVPHQEDDEEPEDDDTAEDDEDDSEVDEDDEITESVSRNRLAARHRSMSYRNLRG